MTTSYTSNKRFAPATQRNREAIRKVLQPRLEHAKIVLEIASGTGEHAVYMARHMPHITWHTSDISPQSLDSIRAWQAETQLPNLPPPQYIDTQSISWPKTETEMWSAQSLEAIVCINMLHISPWASTQGLFATSSTLLAPQGWLYLYGPFKRHGQHTAPSNKRFDQDLRSQDPTWGIRDLEQELVPLVQKHRLTLQHVIDMPANNLSVIFTKTTI
ncbi:MAG: DUF938 domain-containing protein [Myxococcota bacterium]